MKISFAIQAHPSRAEMAQELRGCVGDGARVVYDPDPQGAPSPWRTYRACLASASSGASHVLVLQDDVLVCGHLADGVRLAVEARPDRVLCFFVAGKPANHVAAVARACERGETWAELDLTTWIPVVATLWPVRLVEPLLSWHDAQKFPPQFIADDEIAGRFLRSLGEPALASVPSLVEHPDTVPSIVHGHRRNGDGRDPGRRAWCWVGDVPELDCDARLIDWSSGEG